MARSDHDCYLTEPKYLNYYSENEVTQLIIRIIWSGLVLLPISGYHTKKWLNNLNKIFKTQDGNKNWQST